MDSGVGACGPPLRQSRAAMESTPLSTLPGTLRIHGSLGGVDAGQWNALVGPSNPFLEYGFLYGLERSGCVGAGTGWEPRYLTIEDAGRLLAAVPVYLRRDSYGEFIFDFRWAEAYLQAGLPYYPKATVAVPFTPASGERLLVHPEVPWAAAVGRLADELTAFAGERGLSGVHVLFLSEREQQALSAHGFLPRLTHQFHWENHGYETFDDFLGNVRSKRKKQIRRERRQVAEQGIEIEVLTGEQIGRAHLDVMWEFYRDTIARKWSQAYLNRPFFEWIHEALRDRTLLVLAREGGEWVGGTLNFYKGERLYGRYWGASRDVEALHFECCYYRLIEFAIGNKILGIEAGAQGEHKFLRGFEARPIHSAHWIAREDGRRAIAGFLDQERRYEREVIDHYNRRSPLKHSPYRPADEAPAGDQRDSGVGE